MNNINKIIKIDGAPGITLEGKKGDTGKNGGMLFFTDSNKRNMAFSIFDIWSNEDVTDSPMFIEKYNFCEFTVPSPNDYILTHVQNVAYVYIINTVIDKNDLINGNIDKYVEAGRLSQAYADRILAYYGSNVHTTNDCCLVTEISSLNFFADIQGKMFDLIINKSDVDINYTEYTGIMLENEKMGTKEGTATFAVFNIIPAENSDIKNIKIEAEFYANETSGEMCSIYPYLWSNSFNENLLNKNYPAGYIENYNYKINFDDEKLDNFIVKIKDFEENIEMSKTLIPLQVLSGYSIYIYAYVFENSDSNISSKYFIASFNGDDLIALEQ